MSDNIRNLATAVDAAIDALAQAAENYVTAAHQANASHLLARNQPDAALERAPDWIRAAVGSRRKLASYLGVSPTNPAVTVAQNHKAAR